MGNPGYTCGTACEVFILLFMVRSSSHSQPDLGALPRNPDSRLPRSLQPAASLQLLLFSFLLSKELEKCLASGWENVSVWADLPGDPQDCFLQRVGGSAPRMSSCPHTSQSFSPVLSPNVVGEHC